MVSRLTNLIKQN